MVLFFRVISSFIFFVFLAQVFPVFYFPGSCGLGVLASYGRKSEVLLFCGVLAAGIFFIPSRFWAVFAAVTALSGFFAGRSLKPAGKYFAVFSGVFSGLLTLWMLFYVFSKLDFTAAFFNKISRVLLYTFAGQKEMALEKEIGSFAFETAEILPAIVFMFAAAGFFLNTGIIGFLLKGGKDIFQDTAIIPAPIYLLTGSIAGGIFFSGPFSRFVFKNVFVISVFFFFIKGMEILWFLLSRYGVPAFFKVGFMIFFVFIYPVPAVTGILDTWIDFRGKIKKREEKSEDNSC
ncbi:MAG: DUF2232 domain-containing protein [bacterium]